MTPLHFLFLKTELAPAELADRIRTVGEQLGATRSTLSGSRLREWHAGTKPIPGWAHTAALLLASKSGWRAESPEEIRIASRSFRRQWPDADIRQMVTMLDGAVEASPALAEAWDQATP